jgi:hypothetical protein
MVLGRAVREGLELLGWFGEVGCPARQTDEESPKWLVTIFTQHRAEPTRCALVRIGGGFAGSHAAELRMEVDYEAWSSKNTISKPPRCSTSPTKCRKFILLDSSIRGYYD